MFKKNKRQKIEIRKDCAICGGNLPKRFRTYCSTSCRNKFHNQKRRDYQRKWQQEKRGEYDPGKKQCAICGKWYVQVGSHAIQSHEYDTAREYKEDNDLPIKAGITPGWYKKLKGDIALENGTWKNLKAGKKFWYKPGDPKAKKVTGHKGRHAPASDLY